MQLSKEKGKVFEQNHGGVIYDGDLHITQNIKSIRRHGRVMFGTDSIDPANCFFL